MNKIKLQDLTPDIYYKQSRDFQFLGRLFDMVLNSVKTNSENLYNLQLNDYTDEKLIDLMTLTIGFKSKHNYNVKQLTALCSAFATILKNKGNIKSIELAINALLNAEGITEESGIELTDNNTNINIFIPQALTDTNLLKDLLVYILPAGMSCNIIRELQKTIEATTTVETGNNITSYIGVNTGGPAQTNITAIVPQIDETLGIDLAKDTPGLLANSDIYQPTNTTNDDSEEN